MLILFTVYFLWILLSHPKPSNYLLCGLFGGSFNRELDEGILDKLKMLGFFNQQRGEDSCGYFNGHDIVKGVDTKKKWFDFAVSGAVKISDEASDVFIGHTRKATYGSHTEENAHPFNVNNRIILAHNGTIDNIFTMCSANDISTKDINVDSLGLGYLIDKLGYKVLEKYSGAAALMIYEADKPNGLYMFHGKSRNVSGYEPAEERPLFYMQAAEGIYISSLKGALEWINKESDGHNIHTVPHNELIRIERGVILETTLKINRENANISEPVRKSVQVYPPPVRTFHVSSNSSPSVDILKETLPQRAFDKNKEGIFYWRGRYYHRKTYSLMSGVFLLNKNADIVTDKSLPRVNNFFFYKGLMIESEAKYRYIQDQLGSENTSFYINTHDNDKNFAQFMSHYTKYQVNNADEGLKCQNREMWWINGRYASGGITPIFSQRNYKFNSGSLVSISSSFEKESPFLRSLTPEKEEKKEAKQKSLFPIVRNLPKTPPIYDVPDEVLHYSEFFQKVYTSEQEAEDDLVGIPLNALKEYAEEMCTDILSQGATPALVDKIIKETILSAVFSSKTLEDVMEVRLQSPINYVYSAYEDMLSVLEDEEQETLAEEEEEIKEVDYVEEVTNNDFPTTSMPDSKRQFVDELIQDLVDAESDDKDEAIGEVEDVLKLIEDLKRKGDELSILNSSDFALDCHKEITTYVDCLTVGLLSACHKHNLGALATKVKRVQNIY